MRIVYTTDIHGSEKCFRKFINSAPFYKADVLILGGDITGKAISCILRRGSSFQAELLGREYVLEDEKALKEFEEKVRFNGFYPYICDPEELVAMEQDDALRDKAFITAMLQAKNYWMEWADNRLEQYGVECFAITGNDDHFVLDEVFENRRHIHLVNNTMIDYKGLQIFGYPYSNLTPWNSPREKNENDISSDLEQMYSLGRHETNPSIWNIHVPPYDSGLDIAPELTEDLTPILIGGNESMGPVGSLAVRDFLQHHQPLLGLHGHVHESRGAQKIGQTLCVNPGSRYNEGALLAVIVDIKGSSVENYQLVSG